MPLASEYRWPLVAIEQALDVVSLRILGSFAKETIRSAPFLQEGNFFLDLRIHSAVLRIHHGCFDLEEAKLK